MNINKICLVIVLASFLLGGGLVAAAKLTSVYSDSSSTASSNIEESSEKDISSDDTTSYDDSSSADSSSIITDSSSSEPVSDSSSVIDDSSSVDDSSKPLVRPAAGNEIPQDAQGKELPYDVMPIVKAYFSGDDSALNDKEYFTLIAAEKAINEIITDDMTDYDKAKAVHDYIEENNEYNEKELSAIEISTLDDSSPYGMFKYGKTVCKGYAASYKLLCNMCGLECELIISYDGSKIEHAFNRVLLDGVWYYVDATWDDDNYFPYDYKFFCLTKQQMMYDHRTNETCPETESFKDTYAAHNIIDIHSIDEYKNMLKKSLDSNTPIPYCLRLSKETGVNLVYHKDASAYDFYYDEEENLELIKNASKEINGDVIYDFVKTVIDGEIILIVYIY